jgi:hypothetical protein
MEEHVAELRIGDSRAAVHYRLDEAGKVVIGRIINLDHGNPILCTTSQGSAFDKVAADCAAVIEAERPQVA